MQEINLLQNRVKDTTHIWERQSKTIIAVLAGILTIILAATGLLYYLNGNAQTQLDASTKENNDLQSKLTEQQKTLGDAKAFQAQLANLRFLISNHTYVTPLLDELSKITYKKAQYATMDVTETGKLHLEGMVDTYEDLGKLLLGLSTSSKFTSVKLLSAIPSSGKVNAYVFSVDLVVSPDIFLSKK